MSFNVNLAMTWILFLALFPIAFFWLRHAWRIAIKRDYSAVATKRGVAPADAQRYAPYAFAINLLAGTVAVTVIAGVLLAYFDYATWSAAAGMTIWLKLIADFILSRHAHPFIVQPKTK